MAGEYGLNKYKDIRSTQFGFTNFQWALDGVLARSSQPFYLGSDKNHTIGPVETSFLKSNNIGCIISANHCEMSPAGKKMLNNAGINFHHYRTVDLQAPSKYQLLSVADKIEKTRSSGRATLVYCGYGQGRTGTLIAAWAMLKHLPKQAGANIALLCDDAFLTDFFGVEKNVQAFAVRSAAVRSATSSAPPASDPWGRARSSVCRRGFRPWNACDLTMMPHHPTKTLLSSAWFVAGVLLLHSGSGRDACNLATWSGRDACNLAT